MPPRELDFARLKNLADGIFAVAMTFLAFTIQLPAPQPGVADGSLLAKLHGVLPQLGALVVTYVLAVRYWTLHCHLHSIIVRGNGALLTLNVAFLLAIVVLPFSTDVLGTFPLSGLSVGLYVGNIAAIATLLCAMWHFAVRHPEFLEAPDQLRYARIARRISGSLALVVVVAGLLAQVVPRLGIIVLLMVPVGQFGLQRLASRMEPA
jgi:uncharacterized membrane protein